MVPIMQIVATCSLHVCLAVSVCVCLCLCLSLSVSVSVYVSVCLSLSMSLCVCLCLCRSMYVCMYCCHFPLMSLSVCSRSVVRRGSVCVCEESRCQEGYKGQHCESYDISVIEVSPTHLPQHNLLESLHSLPHQCAGQQNCELIGQRCLQCALEVWSSGRTPATTQPAPTSTLSTPPFQTVSLQISFACKFHVVLYNCHCSLTKNVGEWCNHTHVHVHTRTYCMYTLAILLSPAMEAYKCELLVSGGGCSGVVYYVPTSLKDQR